MPAFGRLQATDDRDKRFLLAGSSQLRQVVARRNNLWPFFDKPFDQGQEGTCVGHGWKAWLATAPLIQSDVDEDPTPRAIYDACLPIDEWSENDDDRERQFGTSVRAGAKVMRQLGYLATFSWAWDVDTAADWLAGIDAEGRFVGGPLVIGVSWYEGMFDTDAEGFLHISGRVAGGHCVCLLGWNQKKGFAYGLNSWGSEWGRNGRFYLPGEDFRRLIAEDGEVCTATEIRLAR